MWPVTRAALFATLGMLAVPSVAPAQVTPVGGVTSIAPAPGTAPVRWPDVAFDPTHDVYLAISGADNITAQFLLADGTASGSPFAVDSSAAYAQAPRAAFGADVGGFLVTWHESVGSATRVRGRVIRYNETTPPADFDISPLGTNWEMGAAVAYSTRSHEFLVAWQNFGTNGIEAQRVGPSGSLLGTTVILDPSSRYHRDPAVGYNPVTDEFVVAFAGCESDRNCFVEAQRVRAGTGALVGTAISLDSAEAATYIPELAFNSATQTMLVVWFRNAGTSASLQGRLVNGDGTAAGPAFLVSDRFASYDANSVAYNPVSNTFVVVTHSTGSQDVALELSATGNTMAPDGVLFGPSTASGNFNPRIASASMRPEWMAVTSTGFSTLSAQRLQTATRDTTGLMPDAGTPSDSGPPIDAAQSDGASDGADGSALFRDATEAGSESPSVVVGGCRCETAPGRVRRMAAGEWGLLLGAALGALLRRARGRRNRLQCPAAILALVASGCGARSGLITPPDVRSIPFPTGTFTHCAEGVSGPASGSALLGGGGIQSGAALTVTRDGGTVTAAFVDQNGASTTFAFAPTGSASAILSPAEQIASHFETRCVLGVGRVASVPADFHSSSGLLAYDANTFFISAIGTVRDTDAGPCGVQSTPAGLWIACQDTQDGGLPPLPVDTAVPAFPLGNYACTSQFDSYGRFGGINQFAADGGSGTLTLTRSGEAIIAVYSGDRTIDGSLRFVGTSAATANVETGQQMNAVCDVPISPGSPPNHGTMSISAGAMMLTGSTLFASLVGTMTSACTGAEIVTTLSCTQP